MTGDDVTGHDVTGPTGTGTGAAALRGLVLFDGLGDDQLDRLWAAGTEVAFDVGEVPFREGKPADFWWVLLDGSLSLVRRVGHQETELGVMSNPGQWAGGFQAWDAHGVYMATAKGVVPGRLLRVPAEALGEVAREWFPFGVHLIAGLVNTVRSIEAKARQRESLVALGTLAAGLAHEINNPASAATRAVDALDQATEALLTSLRRLAESSMTAEQFVALDTLRRTIPTGGRSSMPWASPIVRRSSPTGWHATTSTATGSSPRRSRRPGRCGPLRAGRGRAAARSARGRSGVGGQLADRRGPAGGDP